MNPLLDWGQWLIALVTGVVSAAGYEFLAALRKRRMWKGTRERAISDTWVEIAWPFIQLRLWGWTGKATKDSLYVELIAELRELMARSGPTGTTIPWGSLNDQERALLVSILPRFRRFAVDVIEHIDLHLSHYALLWRDSDRIILLDARRDLRPFAVVGEKETFDTDAIRDLEIFGRAERALRALQALESLTLWVRDNQPNRERPPLPRSNLREL